MNTKTYTTANGAKFYDRVGDTPKADAVKQVGRNDKCQQIIIRHFNAHPFDSINASRLADLYGEYSYLGYRSRLTELKNRGYIIMLSDVAPSHGGKTEHLHELKCKPSSRTKAVYVQSAFQFVN